ncbi:MAG: hypothetical protein R2822_28710 [Spirosomataceae bacterium]
MRIGSGVNGFVMLKDVPIWWEIWRQLNGFPPDYLEDFACRRSEKVAVNSYFKQAAIE